MIYAWLVAMTAKIFRSAKHLKISVQLHKDNGRRKRKQCFVPVQD